jgi:DNA repair protein RadA/Sms
MAKTSLKYICQDCGTVHSKWGGKCEGCGAWNTLQEEVVQLSKKVLPAKRASLEFVSLDSEGTEVSRLLTQINEFDRVCGGGLVPGSVLLVGGDPGIGKSTLLLQVVSKFSQTYRCAYVSGEEAVGQVRLRAKRLGVATSTNLHLASATHVLDILAAVDQLDHPIELLIIDSIQTMTHADVESAPGTVSQVRICTQELISYAKARGVVVILVGHVTKEGVIAGPRVLEHMVDTVLYFEGERNYHYRILRSVKNRFGATDEIGVFEMMDLGLQEVPNPSALFLNQHDYPVSGSTIFAGIEGTRPLLIEIQALVAPSHLAAPRRTSVGWDSNRLAMMIAVLESRCGLSFANKDVFLNVAGGLKITEPASDLAVAAALASTLSNTPAPVKSVFFGEIGLSGEVRAVSQSDLRLKEASKLGFETGYCGKLSKGGQYPDLHVKSLNYLIEMMDIFKNHAHSNIRNNVKIA